MLAPPLFLVVFLSTLFSLSQTASCLSFRSEPLSWPRCCSLPGCDGSAEPTGSMASQTKIAEQQRAVLLFPLVTSPHTDTHGRRSSKEIKLNTSRQNEKLLTASIYLIISTRCTQIQKPTRQSVLA